MPLPPPDSDAALEAADDEVETGEEDEASEVEDEKEEGDESDDDDDDDDDEWEEAQEATPRWARSQLTPARPPVSCGVGVADTPAWADPSAVSVAMSGPEALDAYFSQRAAQLATQMSAAAALRTVSETPLSLPRQRLDRLELVPSIASVAGQVESGAGPTGEGPSTEALPAESIVGELLEGVVNEAARLGEARADLHVELSNLRALIDAERRAKARILSSAIVCPHCEEIC